MPKDSLVSPRVRALQHRLDHGDETALEHFWRDVLRAKGYPVHYVEYHGGHDYSSLAHPLAEALVLMLGQ